MSEEDIQTRIEEREVGPGSPDTSEDNGGESPTERTRRLDRERKRRKREEEAASGNKTAANGGFTGRETSGSSGSGTSGQRRNKSLDTERWEADLALQGVSTLTMQRIGVQTNPPDEKGRDHLAYLIRRLMSKGPLSRVQAVLRTTYDSGRPGKSVLGDVAGFGASMYAANQGLIVALINTYVNRNQSEEAPRVPSKDEMEAALETELSDEQYMQALKQNGFV